MNCDCLEKVPKSCIGKELKGGEVLDAKFKEISFQFGNGTVKAFSNSTLICTVSGRKSSVEVTFAHSFCPFCGTKIELETKPITTPEPATSGEGI